jgi:hypothetical protein
MARERRRPMSPSQAISRAATRRARPVPGTAADHARTLEGRYGRAEAARRAGVSERTWRRWKAGGRPSRVNADRLARETRISPRRETRLRNRGAYVRMSAKVGGGTPGARRNNTRHRTIGGQGFASVHLSPAQMAQILDRWEAGDDEGALEALREALADEYGFPSLEFEDLTRLEFLRDDPNG